MALAQNTLCSSYRIIWLGLFFNFIYMICPIYLTLFQLLGEISSDDTSEKKMHECGTFYFCIVLVGVLV